MVSWSQNNITASCEWDGLTQVTSYVPGTEWAKTGTVLGLGGPGEDKYVVFPSVIKADSGGYMMWYSGYGLDGHMGIYKATSQDGISWTRYGLAINYGEAYASIGVLHPFVMVDDSGTYHMWYTAFNGRYSRILHATSTDSVTWTKLGPELAYGSALDPDGVCHPRVYYDGAVWHMWYTGTKWNPLQHYVVHAYKTTLADAWIKDRVVLANDGPNDNPVAWAQYIVPSENGYDMFYGGRSPDQYPGRICHAYSEDGVQWTKTGIALDRTLPGESLYTDCPSVLFENGQYKMWYAAYNGVKVEIYYACTPQLSEVDLSLSSEDIAISGDAPVEGVPVTITASVHGDISVSSEWEKAGVVLDLGGWGEDLHVNGPCVLQLDNGTYLMFYAGKMNDGASSSWYWRIFRAFSYDGLNWNKEGMVLNYGSAYAGNAVYHPYVWIAPDGIYHMWYVGQNYESGNRARILHATSPDGFNFVYDRLEIDFGSSIEPASVNCPFVMPTETGYAMWYQGTAWSPLANWINHAHKTTLAEAWIKDGTVLQNNGIYDNPHASRPCVLTTDTGYEMFYSGTDASGVGRILHATSADGMTWAKDGIVLEPSLPLEGTNIRWCSVIRDGDTCKMWYTGLDNINNRIFYAEKSPGHIAEDATCTVSFYMDSVDPANLIGSVENVFVPADGQTPVSIDWNPVAGEHNIIAVISSSIPTDSDPANNEASIPVCVSEPEFVDLSVSSNGMAISDAAPVEGTPVTITANVIGDQSVSSEWVKQGVVLDVGGWGEDLRVTSPNVLTMPNGTYVMYYTAKANDGTSTSLYYRIFRAFSYDGLTWFKQGMVLNYGGPYAGNAVYNPTVWIAPDGMYHMWYAGQNYEAGNRGRILHATSTDGFNFIYDKLELNYGSAIEPSGVDNPFVICDDGMMRMWYVGITWSPLRDVINYAEKPTLNDSWVRGGTVLSNNGQYDNPAAFKPYVLKSDDGYEMFYQGYDLIEYRILHATSPDGITWSRDGIVFEKSLPEESSSICYPSVIKDGETYKMWYAAFDGTFNRISYAEKSPGHVAQDATCTVSFYMDSVDPANLIGSVGNVFVPADGQTPVSIDWNPVAGEHQIITVVSDVEPQDSDESNNVASIPVVVDTAGEVDLSVVAEDISVPADAIAGESRTISANIHNLGESQSAWEKQGVVLSPGSSAQYPYVIKDGSIYKMWYTGYGTTYDIYYATSTDHVTWTNYGRVLAHPIGTTYAAAPSVIKDVDGTYKMWYSCQNYNWNSEIYYATSANGITWTQLGKVLPIGPAGSFDSVYACQGYVFKDAGMYKMYYKAYDSGMVSRFGLATSPNGIAWTKYGAVMNTPAGYAAMECPCVLPNDDGTYDMWFSTGKILKATSNDGITWGTAVVELDVTPGGLDSRALYTQCVLRDGDNSYLYYAGDSGSTSYIFLAEAIPAGLDATCTVSFYMDSADPANLIGSVGNVFVPAGGQTPVSIDWMPVAGEHDIIVVVSDVSPPDLDLSNNAASAPVVVSTPVVILPGELAIDKVKLSGIDEGVTLTYYEWELLITIANDGGTAITDVQVKDVLPAELGLLEMNASTGKATTQDLASVDTRSTPLPPTILPVKSTHINWDVGTLEPGQSETLYLKVCTRVNPGGNQEFTSPGTYYINEGACAKGLDSITGDLLETKSQPIIVEISELALEAIISLPAEDVTDNAILPVKPFWLLPERLLFSRPIC